MEDEMPNGMPGEIWVNNFDEKSASKFRKQVLIRSMMDPDAPIVVYIDSYGGYLDSLAKMIETMHEVPNKFITVCMGKAVSCGAILLSNGDIRYCGGYSRVMIHNVSAGCDGDVHALKVNAEQTLKLNERFIGLLANKCGISYEKMQDLIKDTDDSREIWLDAYEAKAFGIVDEIGLPSLTPSVSWECQTLLPQELLDLPVPPKKVVKKKPTTKKAAKRAVKKAKPSK